MNNNPLFTALATATTPAQLIKAARQILQATKK